MAFDSNFHIGDGIRLSVVFTVCATGADADPTTVTLIVEDPSGTQTTYTWAGATVTRDSEGHFHTDIEVDTAGAWHYRWVGTGAVIAAVEGSLYVQESYIV